MFALAAWRRSRKPQKGGGERERQTDRQTDTLQFNSSDQTTAAWDSHRDPPPQKNERIPDSRTQRSTHALRIPSPNGGPITEERAFYFCKTKTLLFCTTALPSAMYRKTGLVCHEKTKHQASVQVAIKNSFWLRTLFLQCVSPPVRQLHNCQEHSAPQAVPVNGRSALTGECTCKTITLV